MTDSAHIELEATARALRDTLRDAFITEAVVNRHGMPLCVVSYDYELSKEQPDVVHVTDEIGTEDTQPPGAAFSTPRMTGEDRVEVIVDGVRHVFRFKVTGIAPESPDSISQRPAPSRRIC